jgi:Lrp/AsnC family transcriptional regulator, leucine-responsive regulatory protein
MSVDLTSRKLLGLLRKDARTKYAELGQAIYLSAPAVFERVKKLEKSGVIRRYTVELDPHAIELSLCAFVQIRLERTSAESIAKMLVPYSEIEECHCIAGEDCILAKVRTRDASALNGLLEQIKSLPGVQRTLTTVVLATLFERGIQPYPEDELMISREVPTAR